jgi:cellulose biosynthesis protein BcsQ
VTKRLRFRTKRKFDVAALVKTQRGHKRSGGVFKRLRTVDQDLECGAFLREKEASGAYDHICIDLPGSREVTLFKPLARSDLVVIPAQASEPDLREALVVVGDIRDVGETTKRAIPYRLLLTKVFPLRTKVTDFAYDELEDGRRLRSRS